jgi:Tol biopolymer transport system component
MLKNKLYLASVSSNGTKGNIDSFYPSISADGRYVAFASYATNLVAGDTNNAVDIFVHDLLTGQTERVSVSTSGKQANAGSNFPVISGNGRYVAFISSATNLIPGDTNGLEDVFVHDRQTGKTERASVSSSGKQQIHGTMYDQGYAGISLSFDGRYVSFVSQATNFANGININTCHYPIGLGVVEPCTNIYLHDRQTGRTSIISVSSRNKSGNAPSTSPNLSSDGQWIVFLSNASNLVAGDTNGQADIFLYHR